MSGRKIPLITGEYYHIFNRGITGQLTYLRKTDYKQKILCFSYYCFTKPPLKLSRLKEVSVEERRNIFNSLEKSKDKLVSILAFVLMPNHFHLLVKQNMDNGISIFLNKITNSYTRYFNIKYKRKGDLYQGVFKAVHVENDEQLLHLSRYIHLNPVASYVVKEKDFLDYPWTSLPDYLHLHSRQTFVNTNLIADHFTSVNDYKKFTLDRVDYAKRLNEIKHLIQE